MRIIAGSRRSLPLKTVEGMGTRPTTDRIKETLFNMLQADVPGAYFLDLFAGSGQMGLEALSRGARYAVFVDNNKNAANVIEDNIKFTKFDKESMLLRMDAMSAISSLEGKYTFDVIFMDPPYNQEIEKNMLQILKNSSILKEDTLIIAEASLDTDFNYVSDLGYEIVKYKTYKSNAHIFLRRG